MEKTKNHIYEIKRIPIALLIFCLVIFFINITLFIILIIILMFMYSITLVKKNSIKKDTFTYLGIMYVMLCWSIFTVINGTNQLDNLTTTLLVFIPSIFFVLFVSEMKDIGRGYYIVNYSLMIFGCMISIYGITLWLFGTLQHMDGSLYQVLNLGPIQLKQKVLGMSPIYRITSITSNPNSLAIWLEFTIASTFYSYHINGRTNKFLYLLILLSQVGALILTYSRSGYIIVFLIFLLWIVIFQKSILKKITVLFTSITLLIPAIVIYLEKYETLNQRFKFDFNDRDEIWWYAISEVLKHPIFGVGFGNSTPYLLNIFDTNIGIHNGFLTLALEIGLIPVIILIFVWIIIMFNLYKIYKKVNVQHFKVVITSLLVFLLLFIPQQMSEAKLFRFDAVHFLWLYILVVSIVYIKKHRNWS